MARTRRIGGGVVVWLLVAAVAGPACGAPPPIGDRPERTLLPSWISDLLLTLNGERAYLFRENDGTEVVHVVGDFAASLGETHGQRFTSREAVIWITHDQFEGRPYRRLAMFLWRDAQIHEMADTWTSGPALFLTLDAAGTLATEVDEFTFQSSVDSPAYRDGSTIRNALIAAGRLGPGEGEAPWRVFDPTGMSETDAKAKPRRVIQFQSQGEFKGPITHDGEQIITVIGRVYLARGGPGTNEYLEIQADSAVVFLFGEQGVAAPAEAPEKPMGGKAQNGEAPQPGAAPGRRERSRRDWPMMSAGFGDMQVQGAYLEGDVLMTAGPNMVRASRLYYDFDRDRALILDAVVRTTIPQRNVPLYLRAAEIRQLSTNRFAATDAVLTTSEFHTPHYHVGARHVELINRTPPEPGGRPIALRAGSFRIEDATLNVSGVPIAYWPSIRGTVDTSETAIKSMRAGYSGDFGVEVETKWNLFSLMGLEEPTGFDTTLSLDYFSDRGPAAGIDAKYERENYFGLFRSYIILDEGTDSLGEDDNVPPPDDLRGRFLIRHRDYLPDDWQLTLETSYISDRNFLQEFFESEFDNDKEQETLLYLKKQRDTWAFTAALQFRILDFETQTERFPDFAYLRLGDPVGSWGTWYSENRAGLVRYRAADQTFEEWLRYGSTESSGTTFRADTRQEITAPLNLGPWRFVPFTAVRGSTWSESIDEGSLARAFASYGVRGSMYLSRVFPAARSSFWDVDGIRHVVKPDVTVWASHTNVDADELFAFDETVEQIDELDGVSMGIRQRWQTKRGRGENRRNVDVVTLDTEIGVFNDAGGEDDTNGYTSYSRPENSISRNYLNNAVIWRVNDRTAVLNEMNYDLSDAEVDVFNVSLAVERTPRLNYVLGYRFIDESESNLLGFDMNYRLSEKYTVAVREAFDLDRGKTLDFTIAIIRRHPRWYTAWSFEVDEAEDDFGVSFTLWPEGIKQAAIGSRRFTGLANTTAINGE